MRIHNIQKHFKDIISEITWVLNTVEDKEVQKLLKAIVKAPVIATIGAGRVGLATKGFAMRLGHLGKTAFALGDMTLPGIKRKDLVLVASGSGETQTIYDLVVIAKKHDATVALITANRSSRMGKLADIIVEMKAPSKTKPVKNFASKQPMTTLNEQSLQLLFDAIVLQLMELMNETHDTMWSRHSTLE